MTEQFSLILCSCPDSGVAESLAQGLVSGHLATCVNILPQITSVYPWEGHIETAQESLLLIKSNESVYPALQQYITDKHPYELPEIIAVPIRHGEPGYLDWINQWLG